MDEEPARVTGADDAVVVPRAFARGLPGLELAPGTAAETDDAAVPD